MAKRGPKQRNAMRDEQIFYARHRDGYKLITIGDACKPPISNRRVHQIYLMECANRSIEPRRGYGSPAALLIISPDSAPAPAQIDERVESAA